MKEAPQGRGKVVTITQRSPNYGSSANTLRKRNTLPTPLQQGLLVVGALKQAKQAISSGDRVRDSGSDVGLSMVYAVVGCVVRVRYSQQIHAVPWKPCPNILLQNSRCIIGFGQSRSRARRSKAGRRLRPALQMFTYFRTVAKQPRQSSHEKAGVKGRKDGP